MLLYGYETWHPKKAKRRCLTDSTQHACEASSAFARVTLYKMRRSGSGLDAHQYHQLSGSDARTGWVIYADFCHHNQQIRYCILSPLVKKTRRTEELLTEHQPRPAACQLLLEQFAYPCQGQKKLEHSDCLMCLKTLEQLS